jgi:endonuclease YncB( thermonuclease family)
MLALLAAAILYVHPATVDHVIDGDTIAVTIPDWPLPRRRTAIRIYGLDTPEHMRPPAQAACEVALGVAAMDFARTLVKPGQVVTYSWSGHREKYGRELGSVTLPDGRDWATTMIAAGLGRAYGQDGNLHKATWCADPAPAEPPH